MNPVFARVGSMFGIFALTTGLMAAACSAPPAGGLGTDEQDQTDDDNGGRLPTSSTSSTEPKPGTTNDAPANTQTPPSSTPAPTPDASAPPVTPPPPDQCNATADWMSCIDCCDQANPGGFEVDGQAWDDCICQTACAQECGGSYCNGGDPSFACEQCMQNAQQCDQAADTACQANAACAAAIACIQSSQCESKP